MGKPRTVQWLVSLCLTFTGVSCGDKSSPVSPAPPPVTTPSGPPRLTAPTPEAPGDDQQMDTLRPTLTVRNGTSDQTGARTYDFQISDTSTFSSVAGTSFAAAIAKVGVGEDASGKTSFVVDQDLQPATRFYWRARMTEGSTVSDWSTTAKLRTKIQGFNRPGELYDPLVNGETVGELRFKRTTFIAGKGLRIEDSDSYVRYRLPQTLTNGEFSVDTEGLSGTPVSENPDTAKLKIISMADSTSDAYMSDYLCNVQYRGFNGNPNNAISFKCLFGDDELDHKLEPDLATRRASRVILNPANTYYWKATWGNFFHVLVQDGGVGGVGGSGSGIGGATIYDYGQTTTGIYSPAPHYAYLGVNNSGSETGSWPGVIYRNVWIGNKPRAASLGTALAPLK